MTLTQTTHAPDERVDPGARGHARRPSARRVLVALLCLRLLLPARGEAQSYEPFEASASDPSEGSADREDLTKQASALFERGVELYGEGNLDASMVQFERAYELVPNPRLLYNLAQIQAERHRYVAAIALYEQYLRDSGDELAEARKAESLAQLEKLRPRVARLTVESDVASAKLYVNDELVGTLPLAEPLWVDSGVSLVRVEKSGYLPAQRKLKVAGGEEARLVVPLQRALPGDARAASSDSSSGKPAPSYTAFWIASAATVALAGATLTTGLLARQADYNLDVALNRISVTPRDLDDDRARLRTLAGLTDGFAIASVAALGFAVYFAIDPPRSRSDLSSSARGRTSLRTVRRTVGLAPSARGLTVHGTF